MELADGLVFRGLIPRKSKTPYTWKVTYDNGVTEELCDPYSFAPQVPGRPEEICSGHPLIQFMRKWAPIPLTIDGVSGVYFSVWAPCAVRVSVVGISTFGMEDAIRSPP